MTTAQALATIRNLLNESSAGFFTDAQCYDFLSRAQDDVVSILIQKWRQTQNTPLQYFPIPLEPLISTADVAPTSTNNYISLSSYTTLIEVFHCEFYKTGVARRLVLTRLPLPEMLKIKGNVYHGSSYVALSYVGQIYYTIYGSTLMMSEATFDTTDWTGFRIYYWVSPTQVASAQELQVSDEAHPAIIKLAMFYALTQDGQHNKAHNYLEQALKFTTNL